MVDGQSIGRFVVAIFVSLGVHVGAGVLLALFSWAMENAANAAPPIDVHIIETPEQIEDEAVAAASPPEPPEPARAEPPPRLREPPPEEPDEPPPPAAEEPLDFTGTTLVAPEGDSTWTTAVGNGEAMTGPISRPGLVTGRSREGALGGSLGAAGEGPPLVGVGDLSSLPTPPPLDDVLQRHYPRAALTEGIEGRAVVRVRIDATGRASVVSTVSESHEGFAAACRRTVNGSRWTPPLDRNGSPVTTIIRFTCDFEVRY